MGEPPNDARNLRVEPADPGHKAGTGVNNLKDPVETKLHTAVCSGKVTLRAAQQAIVTDWTTALSKRFHAESGGAYGVRRGALANQTAPVEPPPCRRRTGVASAGP